MDNWPVEGLEEIHSCPLCAKSKSSILYSGLHDDSFGSAPGEWCLFKCDVCGCAYMNPRPTPAAIGAAYKDYYTHSVLGGSQGNIIRKIVEPLRNGYLNNKFGYHHEPCLDAGKFILRILPPFFCAMWDYYARNLPPPVPGSEKLLDVGCGSGDFLVRAGEAGWQAEGLEPDPNAVCVALGRGLRVLQGDLDHALFPDNHFDVVTLCHVIEHVHNPVNVMKECLRILKPGGLLWLSTPNIKSLGHKRYKSSWRGLEVPRHLVLFDGTSLDESLSKAGFDVVRFIRRGYHAATMLEQSESIERGEMPANNYRRGFVFMMWVLVYELIGWFRPDLAEELVVTAKKPGK